MIIENCKAADIIEKNSKVLLVNPPIYDYLSHTNPDSMGKWGQPTGLLKLSTFLKQNGCDAFLIDCLEEGDNGNIPVIFRKNIQIGSFLEKQYHMGMSFDKFEKILKELSFYPEHVFITSAMTYWWESVEDTIGLIRRIFPKSEIILGGIYPTLIPKHAEAHISADIIVKGDLADLFDTRTDFSIYQKSPRYSVIFSSKGCPWDCSYCAQREINGGSIRYRDPEDVANEIEEKYRQFGVRKIVFFADNFLANKTHFREIMQHILDRNLKIILDAPKGMEPDLLDIPTLLVMKKAGWQRINLALETVDDDLRQELCRKHTNEIEFKNSVEMCRSVGFSSDSIRAFVLYGMPAENLRKVEETALFIHQQGAFITPMPYTAVPGSKMYLHYLPYIERGNRGIEMLHERLFPFAEYNGYSPEDYLQLERLMVLYNSKLSSSLNYKDQSFNIVNNQLENHQAFVD